MYHSNDMNSEHDQQEYFVNVFPSSSSLVDDGLTWPFCSQLEGNVPIAL
jgi:hypothetical protein